MKAKRIALIVAILFIPLICYASFLDMQRAVIAGRATSAAAGATDYTADANAQGAWLFNDNLNDSTSKGNTLTDGSGDGVPYDAAMPNGLTSGKSVHLDGSADYLTLAGTSLSANFPGAKSGCTVMSFALWVKHDANSTHWNQMISYEYTWQLSSANSTDVVSAYFKDQGDQTSGYLNVDDITDITAWRHYVVSFDGSTSQITYWISTESSFGDVANGATLSTGDADSIKAYTTGFNFNLGNMNNGTYFWDGYIAQPIVFDRTLSAAEAQEIYTHGIDGND